MAANRSLTPTEICSSVFPFDDESDESNESNDGFDSSQIKKAFDVSESQWKPMAAKPELSLTLRRVLCGCAHCSTTDINIHTKAKCLNIFDIFILCV